MGGWIIASLPLGVGGGWWGVGNPNLVRILKTIRNIGRSLTCLQCYWTIGWILFLDSDCSPTIPIAIFELVMTLRRMMDRSRSFTISREKMNSSCHVQEFTELLVSHNDKDCVFTSQQINYSPRMIQDVI